MDDSRDLLIRTLTEALASDQKQIAELQESITKLNITISGLNETIEYLKKKLYGKSSEKTPDPNQLVMDIFNEAEAEAAADPEAKEPQEKDIVQSVKKKGNRKGRDSVLKDDIPVKEVLITLPDHTCPDCGSEMKVIGKQYEREDLVIVPAKLYRVRYYTEVLKCEHCSAAGDTDVIVQAEAPQPLMKHSLASASTVSYIMYRKYALHEPLYRLEQEFLQMGAGISRGVMARWIIYCALHYMKPIYDRMHEELVKRDILHADEVPCQVLKEEGRPAQSKSYMWVYLTGNDGLPGIVLYDYQPGRSGKYAEEFLKGFHGYLHCDGYQGYNKPADIERVGCLAHARRYFFDAIPSKKVPDTPKTPGEIGVEYYNQVFQMEMIFKDLSPEEIKQKRQERELPVLEQLFAWIETLHPTKGSRLEKAVIYSINQKQNLLGYLKDGRLEISNNAAERRCKVYVMGRKNFLFHDQVDGAEASAIIYSLVESAKINGLNISGYLKNVLLNMPGLTDGSEGIEDMLPWSDFMQKNCPKVEKKTADPKPVGMK